MLYERIYGMFDRDILLQRPNMGHHHVRVERLRMVVIEFRTLLVRQFGMSLIVIVVAQCGHIVLAEGLLKTFDQSTLAGTCTAGYTYYRNFHDVEGL